MYPCIHTIPIDIVGLMCYIKLIKGKEAQENDQCYYDELFYG